MSENKLLSRIAIEPNICSGKPFIRGHQIRVSLILEYLAKGMTNQEIIQQYPHIQLEDILACLAYGAEIVDKNLGFKQTTRDTKNEVLYADFSEMAKDMAYQEEALKICQEF